MDHNLKFDFDKAITKVDMDREMVSMEAKMMSMASDVVTMLNEQEAKSEGITDSSLLLSEGHDLKAKYIAFRKDCIDNLKKQNLFANRFYGQDKQLTQDEEATIMLSFIAQAATAGESAKLTLSDEGTTTIGNVSTEFDARLYTMPSFIDQDDVLVSRCNSMFFDSQAAIYQVQSALFGILDNSIRGALAKTTEAPAYTLNQFAAGYFGDRISLDMEKLSIQRNINGIGGNQADYAQARAYAQLLVKMTQLMNLIAYRTKVDNGFEYSFSPYSDAKVGFVPYGRPTENTYTFVEPAFIKNADGSLVINQNSNQFAELSTWYVNQANGIVRNTAPLLDGLAMNLETVNGLAQQIFNNNDTAQAISFGAGLTYDFGPDRLYDSVPWLKGMKILEVDGMARLGTNDFGAINQVQYYLDTAVALPIFKEFEGQNLNGLYSFMPNERSQWLSNMQGVPQGATPYSDPRAVSMRVISSLEDHTANDPYMSIEVTMKMIFLSFFSAMDYKLSLFKDA